MDAANRSLRQNIYTYTNFLDINEQSIFTQMQNALNFVSFKIYGAAMHVKDRWCNLVLMKHLDMKKIFQ